MLCVLVWNKDKIVYQALPLSYRMWQKEESKLKLAASMVRQAMPELQGKANVIILCDSHREGGRFQAPVLQYGFPSTAADILRMAGESALKPDGECLDG